MSEPDLIIGVTAEASAEVVHPDGTSDEGDDT